MPSLTDIEYAADVAAQFAASDPKAQDRLMLLLAEYDTATDFEGWCDQQRVDKEDPQQQADFHALHLLYLGLWRRDEKDFFRRLSAARFTLALKSTRRKH